jgi:hypothetical protein
MKPRIDIYRCLAFTIIHEEGESFRLTFCPPSPIPGQPRTEAPPELGQLQLRIALPATSAHTTALAVRATREQLREFGKVFGDAQKMALAAFDAFKLTITNQPHDFVIRNGGFAIIVDKTLAVLLSDALLTV